MNRPKRATEIVELSAFPPRWRDYVSRGQPFVARGAAKSRLTLKVVEALGEATEVIVKNQVTNEVGQASLSELVRCLDEEGAVWYLAQQPVPSVLGPELPKTPISGVKGLLKPNAWLGSARAHTPLHQDHMHNLVVQLDGRKRFTVFAPQDDRYLYRERTSERRLTYSQIRQPSAVDRQRYPEYRHATPFEIELAPRDIFFMPAFWWHEVLTLESSLMLNSWWPPSLSSLRGVDIQETMLSPVTARLTLLKYLDLSIFKSDLHVVQALGDQKLTLLSALLLGEVADEFRAALAKKHLADPLLYPETAQALLSARLSSSASALLTQIQNEVVLASSALTEKVEAPPALTTAVLGRKLRRLFSSNGLTTCTRLVHNNAIWLKNVATDAYL